jgi:DNA-binding transcriptional MerR regulator
MPRFSPPPLAVRTLEARPVPTAGAGAQSFTIGDLARDFGLTPRALRFYESKGMLQPKRRGLTRLYSAADRARLALILQGKELGLSLREIRESLTREDATVRGAGLVLSATEVTEKIAALETQKREIERALAGLRGHEGAMRRPRGRRAA